MGRVTGQDDGAPLGGMVGVPAAAGVRVAAVVTDRARVGEADRVTGGVAVAPVAGVVSVQPGRAASRSDQTSRRMTRRISVLQVGPRPTSRAGASMDDTPYPRARFPLRSDGAGYGMRPAVPRFTVHEQAVGHPPLQLWLAQHDQHQVQAQPPHEPES